MTREFLRPHIAAIVLAGIAALIVLAPNVMLWREDGFHGMEMMMLDAENHYLARIAEVSQGDITAANTFLPNKDLPYATPALGEGVIALFGKIFHMEAARAAVVSKALSVFAITLLIYALGLALSRSRIAALLAAGVTMLGNNLTTLSPAPFLDILHASPSGGPFIFFSRLVNPSIAGIFLFAALFLIYKEFFEHEKTVWWRAGIVGMLVGASLYITPFVYTFLGLVIFITFVWFLARREYTRSLYVFLSGTVGLLVAIPFIINYIALVALPGYPHLEQFLGLVHRREFILGALLPLMAAAVVFFWPREFSKSGKVFFLVCMGALLIVLNQQLITGTYLQPGHYHWYLTKPLAGVLGGLFAGYLIERFMHVRFRNAAAAFILMVLIYNSMGFLAPWYASTRAVALAGQQYAPLVEYLNTVEKPQVVWTDGDTSDYIPIYTIHDAPNSVNVGSYPIPEEFFEHRLFLEYRLRGVPAAQFEKVIREEAHHVGNRLWGLWLREKFGDPSAVPEEEFVELSKGYAAFYALSWREAFETLGITLVVARQAEEGAYSSIPALAEGVREGGFIIYELQR